MGGRGQRHCSVAQIQKGKCQDRTYLAMIDLGSEFTDVSDGVKGDKNFSDPTLGFKDDPNSFVRKLNKDQQVELVYEFPQVMEVIDFFHQQGTKSKTNVKKVYIDYSPDGRFFKSFGPLDWNQDKITDDKVFKFGKKGFEPFLARKVKLTFKGEDMDAGELGTRFDVLLKDDGVLEQVYDLKYALIDLDSKYEFSSCGWVKNCIPLLNDKTNQSDYFFHINPKDEKSWKEWKMTIDLGTSMPVKEVHLQKRSDCAIKPEWCKGRLIKSLQVHYSEDGKNWTKYKDGMELPTNQTEDQDSTLVNAIKLEGVTAQKVAIVITRQASTFPAIHGKLDLVVQRPDNNEFDKFVN